MRLYVYRVDWKLSWTTGADMYLRKVNETFTPDLNNIMNFADTVANCVLQC